MVALQLQEVILKSLQPRPVLCAKCVFLPLDGRPCFQFPKVQLQYVSGRRLPATESSHRGGAWGRTQATASPGKCRTLLTTILHEAKHKNAKHVPDTLTLHPFRLAPQPTLGASLHVDAGQSSPAVPETGTVPDTLSSSFSLAFHLHTVCHLGDLKVSGQ